MIHLLQLDALDQIDVLQSIVETYRERTGSFPKSWDALIEAGLLNKAPVNPSGSPYILNIMTEKVELFAQSRLSGLPSVDPDLNELTK